jgi:hypothetical protein
MLLKPEDIFSNAGAMPSNPSTGACLEMFCRLDLSVPIVVAHEAIAPGCTVKRCSTPVVRMPFSVKAGRDGQRSFRRHPDHAP